MKTVNGAFLWSICVVAVLVYQGYNDRIERNVHHTIYGRITCACNTHCQHNIHMHLEVIFTKEDIKRFAQSVFSGDILAEFCLTSQVILPYMV